MRAYVLNTVVEGLNENVSFHTFHQMEWTRDFKRQNEEMFTSKYVNK